jgi:hypothetical protein
MFMAGRCGLGSVVGIAILAASGGAGRREFRGAPEATLAVVAGR